VGSVPLNADGAQITPDNKKQLAAAWSAVGRFGKYKAFLDLQYGENQLASVQDTVYFWIFPWKEILFALLGVGILAVVGTFVIHMRAVARPVPQRSAPSRAPSTPTDPAPASPNTSARRSFASSLQPPSQVARAPAPHGAAVVLSGRQRSAMFAGNPTQTSGQVTVRPNARHAAPTVAGDTISLVRRT
jgi:hypothetical protein